MSSNPPISVSKIPSLKELSDQLGFQSASLKDTSNFMEGTRAWRKSFKTSSGRLGTTLLQWKDLSTQQDLEEMAQRFVDHKNNSDRFWSSQRDWFQDSNIEFPEDRAQIVLLLKQVFWRQNRYAKNNSHYAQNNAGMRDESREDTTPDRRTEDYGSPENLPLQKEIKAPIISRDTFEPVPKSIPAKIVTKPGQAPADCVNFDSPIDLESDEDVIIVSRNETSGHKRPMPNNPVESPPAKKKYHRPTSSRRTTRKHAVRVFPGDIPVDPVEGLMASKDEEPKIQRGTHGSKSLPDASKDRGETLVTISQTPTVTQPSDCVGVQKAATMCPEALEEAPIAIIFHVSDGRDGKATRRRVIPKSESLSQSLMEEPPVEKESSFPVSTMETGKAVPEFRQAVLMPVARQHQEQQLCEAIPLAQEKSKTISKVSIQNTEEFEEPISVESPRTTPKPASPKKSELRHTSPKEQQQKTITEPTLHSTELSTGIEETPPQNLPQPPSTTDQASMLTLQTQAIASKPRQKKLIPLWIITREPRYSEELWDEGKFMGTTLATFFEGVFSVTQRDRIEKIKLTLHCPKFDTKITVFKDADDAWASAKETFTEKVREAKAEARVKRQADQPFKILIEPLYEEGSLPTGNLEDEEDDFEF